MTIETDVNKTQGILTLYPENDKDGKILLKLYKSLKNSTPMRLECSFTSVQYLTIYKLEK